MRTGKVQAAVTTYPDTSRIVLPQGIDLIAVQTVLLLIVRSLLKRNGVRLDLIICDINMPGLDGYGTLKAMREHEATATIPFVFLSGSVDRIAAV